VERLAPAGRLRFPSYSEACAAVHFGDSKQKASGVPRMRAAVAADEMQCAHAHLPCACIRVAANTITQHAVAREAADGILRGCPAKPATVRVQAAIRG
jgi:hypothetical protein